MKKRLFSIIILLVGFLMVSLKIANTEEEFYFPEKTITLDFKDASLKDILKVFSIQSGLNFIASETIEDKKITLYLDKVPLREAMDKLFKANNLIYELDEVAKIFIVKESGLPPIETVTKIYPLKYIPVSSSFLREEMYSYLSEEGKGAKQPTQGTGVTEAIKKILSEKGSLIEEPSSNSLIITDIPAKFPLIEAIIKQLDVPQPQIMLEVEMLDVSRTLMEKIGIKFGDITAYPSIFTVTFTGPVRQTNFPLKSIKSTPSEFTPGTISFAGSYQMLLDFIKSQTDTKILARPRILTINNQPAEIKITADEVVGTKRTRDPDTGEITLQETRASEFEITKEGVGVFLRVTPQVNQETQEITMFVYPKVSATRQSSTFSGFRDPEARSTKSLVRIKDGQTIIIAGLIRKETSEVITKLPLLGDLPLLGALFKHKERTKDEDRELLVFITPHILKEKTLAKAFETPKSLEREQVSQTEVLRERFISNTLNNFEKIK